MSDLINTPLDDLGLPKEEFIVFDETGEWYAQADTLAEAMTYFASCFLPSFAGLERTHQPKIVRRVSQYEDVTPHE